MVVPKSNNACIIQERESLARLLKFQRLIDHLSQVMWSPSHILHQRFQPSSKTQEGLHATHISLAVISGQYVCKENYGASPIVEIEVSSLASKRTRSK